MIAVQYAKSIPRYLALRTLGPRIPALYTSRWSPVTLRVIPEPRLPTPRWLRIRPRLSGICGSDLATVCAKGSPYLSPLTSTPFVLGHEVVGTVSETGSEVQGFPAGTRVVVQPALGCTVRGITAPCDACARGAPALCRNITRGDIAAGIQTGYCRDTGGAWSESLVAHQSQVYRVPEELDDRLAVLTEPLACCLHAVLRSGLADQKTDRQSAVVMGCGAIGLLTLAVCRTLHPHLRLIAVAKYPHQQDHARRLGADEVVVYQSDLRRRYRDLADLLDAELHLPELGKPTVIGGADVIFDCVASSSSIDDCCRMTTAGGKLVLVGMPGIPKGVDWTAIWYKELTVRAAYAYGEERRHGQTRSTFDLALDYLRDHGEPLRPLVGEPFALGDYRRALRAALDVGSSGTVKTVFEI